MSRRYFPIVAVAVVAILYGLTPLARIVLGTAYRRASAEVTQVLALGGDSLETEALDSDPVQTAKTKAAFGRFEGLDTQRHSASAATYVRTSRSPRPPPALLS